MPSCRPPAITDTLQADLLQDGATLFLSLSIKLGCPKTTMDKPNYSVYDAKCPTRQVLDRLADKWTVLIVGVLTQRPHRFGELRRSVAGILAQGPEQHAAESRARRSGATHAAGHRPPDGRGPRSLRSATRSTNHWQASVIGRSGTSNRCSRPGTCTCVSRLPRRQAPIQRFRKPHQVAGGPDRRQGRQPRTSRDVLPPRNAECRQLPAGASLWRRSASPIVDG